MELVIYFDNKFDHAQYDDHVLDLMGKPIKITFHYSIPEHTAFLKNLFFIPVVARIKFTEVIARIDTSKGSIISEFLIMSEIEESTCTLFTNYNHNDSAILDYELINFYKLVEARKNTRKAEDQLPDSLSRFHHWLASEIAGSLKQTYYFSNLHHGTEIKSFNLQRLPKIWKNF